ncbi:MAG: NUDIX hydrolase [Chlamydiales bacterium]|nr:NUDIX hydrolase [Chlamydiales bacterium]
MKRSSLFRALDGYEKLSQDFFAQFAEEETLNRMRSFAEAHPNCLDRENLDGHFTASAFILSPDRKKVVLTFHAKIQKWMQLGGHADGHPLMHEVAMREAEEESGLSGLSFFFSEEEPLPFDLDIHLIAAHKGVPEHHHYDLRYLLLCKDESKVRISDESLDLKWIELDQISSYTQESSVLRQVQKSNILTAKTL